MHFIGVFFLKSSICVHIPPMKYNQGQNHLETNFAETNFPNAKILIWANQNAQISVFAFGKIVCEISF